MATVPPPPSKRRKLETLERSKDLQNILNPNSDDGVMRVQFFDERTGLPVGNGPILVPATDATYQNLELLLNKLEGYDPSEYKHFRITAREPEKKTSNNFPIPFPPNLHQTVITPGIVYPEMSQWYQRTEEDLFRVQAVSRSASRMAGHGKSILAAQFSPKSSSRMVTGSGDNTAKIWDCDTYTVVHTLKGHTSWVMAVSWSPDDCRIATGGMDNTVRLWDPKTGKQVGKTMTGHTKWIRILAWEPFHVQKQGEPRLASCSKDCTVRIWLVNQQKIDMVLSGHTGSVSCVRWGGVGFIYTSAEDKTIKVWNASNGTLAHTLTSHMHWVNHLALSTDFVLRTAYHDHTGQIPDTEEDKIAKAKRRFIEAATIDGELVERVVSASEDCTMYLWELSKGTKPIARMTGHQKGVAYATFSPDGRLIASTGFDNHSKIWNAKDGKFISTLRGHVAPVYRCCFSADSRYLVTASKDTTVKVWDMQTHKLKNDLPGHQDEVQVVDWSPDGKKVCSGGKDKAVRVWIR